MTIQPGSLDYLYYNGILDHIPYEAYEYTPVTKSGMTQYNTNMPSGMSLKQAALGYTPTSISGEQYLNSASHGELYNSYNMNDTYSKSDSAGTQTGEGYSIKKHAYGDNSVGSDYNIKNAMYGDDFVGSGMDMEKTANGEEGKSFRESITEAAESTKDSVLHGSIWKGLAALGLLIVTPILIFKTRKKTKI